MEARLRRREGSCKWKGRSKRGVPPCLFTSLSTIQFNAGAPAYTFNLAIQSLTLTGAGILDSSSNKPTFSVTGQPTTFGLVFQNVSSAGDAIIINSAQGHTDFFNNSSAGAATITSETGTLTAFHGTSTGGSSRFIANSTGGFDISGLTSTAMTAGSIEGSGGYNLGSKALTVGSNNLSTEVSGVIADGGIIVPRGVGGSLIKVGTGTLTLSGTNTYSGGTTVAGGVISVALNANLGNIAGGITLQGGELLTTADGFSSARGVTLSSPGSALAATTGTTATYTGTISSTGTVGLTIGDGVHAGTVFLASGGANNYTGVYRRRIRFSFWSPERRSGRFTSIHRRGD